MRLLITGSKGFIGSHAIEQVSKHNHVVMSSFDWVDHKHISEIFHITDIDAVMHFGAISSTTETDIEKIMYQNYDYSVWLLNLCNDLGIQFQWSSSASIYGLGTDFRETANPDPRTPYAWSKYLFERYIKNKHWKIPIQGFRYFNVYGDKGEDHKGDQASPYHKFRKQALETGIIKVFKHSESYFRDFIHVDTLLDTQFKFLNLPISGVWNIGTGTPKSFMQVAEEVAEKYNAVIEVIPMPANLINSYQKYTCADLTNLNKQIGKLKNV
jgi:ADP-L-glycero-D-manno-heptose 6-epimerase